MQALDREAAELRIAKNTAALVDALAGDHTFVLNLGVGIPTLVSSYLQNQNVYVHAEHGILGIGHLAGDGEGDWDLINAGRQLVTEVPGCCYLSSADAFGMVRGGHVDATVLGAFCVDEDANIANWIIPGGKQLGVGGAMDLVSGARIVIAAMLHCQKNGETKLIQHCNLPITGYGEVDYVVTEYCVLHYNDHGYTVMALAPGVTLEQVQSITEFPLNPGACRKEMIP